MKTVVSTDPIGPAFGMKAPPTTALKELYYSVPLWVLHVGAHEVLGMIFVQRKKEKKKKKSHKDDKLKNKKKKFI